EIGPRGWPIFLARPAVTLRQFIFDALRPAEHDPVLFISYAPKDDYGKGRETDSGQIDRVVNALRAARINPWLDEDLGSIVDRDPAIKAINGSAGGALLLTPVSHGDSETTTAELLALAYRRWAKPDFALAAFLFRRSLLTLSPAIGHVETLDLDHADEGAVHEYVGNVFGSLSRLDDEGYGLEVERQRLEMLMRKRGLENSQRIVDSILDKGVHAELSASEFSKTMTLNEAREIV